MAQETDTRHRPGSLKQQNKSHKHGRHRTKGEMNRESRGKTNSKTMANGLCHLCRYHLLIVYHSSHSQVHTENIRRGLGD